MGEYNHLGELILIAYVLNNQSEIIFKISTSDLFVSSKPGVSTKHRLRHGKETLMTEISLVKDSKPCPTIPAIPVANSMNYIRSLVMKHFESRHVLNFSLSQ